MVALKLAEKFGKEVGFAIGIILLWPIFLAILAFGDAEYQDRRGKRNRKSLDEDEDEE